MTDPRIDDTRLLAEARGMWERLDPPPEHLADRVLFALELEDLDSEFELLRLTERGDALAGTRAAAADASSTATHITFSGEELTVMLAVSRVTDEHRRVDGWIAPAARADVVAHTAGGEVDTSADQTGRFVLDRVPAGMLRLVFRPEPAPDGTVTPFVTPTVEV